MSMEERIREAAITWQDPLGHSYQASSEKYS